MRSRLLLSTAVVVAGTVLAGWSAATPAVAQIPVPTSTTAPPSDGGGGGGGGGQDPAPPSPAPTPPSTPAPSTPPSDGSGGSGGSGGPGGSSGGSWWVPPAGGIPVPDWARAIIDAHPRTPPNDNSRLLAALKPLEELGMSAEEAAVLGSGRFIIAGPAHFMDDFLFPRWGPAFRFHQGCDVMAAHGTPVRSPADGIARVGNSTLGGLSVYVTEPDGTFYYMAHLSGLADGIATGVPVRTGQVVGFVGDSGNARGGAPHVHFEIHPRGGDAIDPKPVLDQWLLEAEAAVPDLLASFRPPAPSALVGTTIVRQLFDDDPSEVPVGPAAPATTAPTSPPSSVVTATTGQTIDDVDWDAVARLAEWQEARAGANAFLGPLVPPVLSNAVLGDG